MNTDRLCGCKSFRSCLQCEKQFELQACEAGSQRLDTYPPHRIVTFCPDCCNVSAEGHTCPTGQPFPGVKLVRDFISDEEQTRLIAYLDTLPWDLSQSGRRKQNFGPKANFKKRKAKVGDFGGFPAGTKYLQDRFSLHPDCLSGFRAVEQCSIEYVASSGSCIDPHIDDCWIWGERIVQLNLLSDSVLTFFPFRGSNSRYNLSDVLTYPQVIDPETGLVRFNPFSCPPNADHPQPAPHYRWKDPSTLPEVAVRVPVPQRSLLILTGEPRYQWEHCILRKDIVDRRVVIAYRELTPTYLPGGQQQQLGQGILERAALFW